MIFGKDMSTLRKLMLLKAATGVPLNEYEAIGNPLTFETNKAKPLRSVLASWQPHQSGTGDPSPENIRPVLGMDGVNVWQTGTNVFDGVLESGYINTETGQDVTGTNNIRSKNYIPVLPNTKYITSFVPTTSGVSNMRVLFYGKDKSFTGTSLWARGGVTVLTIPSDCYFIRFYMDGAYTRGTERDIAINYPSTETDYHPYHGTSYAVEFPVVGHNQWDEEWVEGVIGKTGEIDPSTRRTTDFIPVLPNTQYYFCAPSSAGNGRYAYYDEDKTPVLVETATGLASNQVFTTPANAYFMRITFGSGYGSTYNHDIAINYPSSATSYEPYTNTVYGGTLDLTTGVLTAEWIGKQIKDLSWTYNSSYGGYFTAKGQDDIVWDYDVKLMCDALKVYPNRVGSDSFAQDADDNSVWFYGTANATTKRIRIKHTDATTKEDMVDDLGEYYVFYAITEPIVLATLSPTQITALIGNNTMWASADNLSVTYLKKG